ncbi:MAG: lamin tail domain-containing protein [archaeon]|nr:lamin tail domain-containing protein [archaeon]
MNVLLLALAFVPVVNAEIANHVVISEIYVDGDKEWIELYNPTDSSVNLHDWTIDTRTYADDAKLLGEKIIPKHGFYLIGDNETVGVDYYETILLADAGGCVRIQNATGATVDAVGWGDNCIAGEAEWEGTAYPTDPDAGESLQRKVNATITQNGYGPAWDSNNNSADFFIQDSPNPQNSTWIAEHGPLPPVPELPSIVLLAFGLLMLATYIVLKRR